MTTESTAPPLDQGAPPPDPGYQPDAATPPEQHQADQYQAEPQPDPRLVPYVALKETREKFERERERFQQQFAEQQRRVEVIEQLALQNRAQPAPPTPEPELPPYEQDPAAHLRALNERNTRALQQVQQEIETYKSDQQRTAGEQALIGWANSQEMTFQAEQPDYPYAVHHFRAHRARELQAMGVPPEHWQSVLHRDELAIMHTARQQGRNPAEAMYAVAQHRGYQPPQQQRQAAPPPPPQADPRAEQLRRDAGRSINAMPGSTPAPTGLRALLSMSTDEFEKATKDPAKFRALAGG